eukprot:TRINITY_DN2301_c0_g1_i1.p1 TRINITY_DN2301_c0_g1~~TRINITY_DN2301_c0_g1_i1.p1  ORF type:complete len:593 (+),score=166.54 TRINITY_DN2301_c0_g1_i1:61-1839(+)
MSRRAAEQAGPIGFGGDEHGLLMETSVVLDEHALPIGLEGEVAPPGHPEWPEVKREEWGSSLDYIVVLLGYAIGIGNLWRFPYLVGKNGGGAFILPYLICLCLVAAPLFILELILGQALRCSTIECFKRIHPYWTGVAVASTSMVVFVATYYNILLAYCVVYLLGSFESPLPWSDNASNHTRTDPRWANVSDSQYYFSKVVLNEYTKDELKDISGIGGLQWHLVTALMLIWVIVYFALSSGIQSSSKAAWITVPLPVILIIVMFFRAVTLPGAGAGVAYYMKFEFSKMMSASVWTDACGQILFSLSPGMGTAITMSSYTRPKENVHKIGLIIIVSNSSFSIVGGFVVFALLGNISHETGQAVADLANNSGAGLAFVALANGISKFSTGSNFFSILFFIMLLMLGLDSTFAWVETVNAVICDWIDKRTRHGKTKLIPFLPEQYATPSRRTVAKMTAMFLFLCSLPYCTRAGFYLIDVVDHFCATYILLIVCCLECVMVTFFFGYSHIQRHMETTVGYSLSSFWIVCWKYIAPAMCFILLMVLFINDVAHTYEDYPPGIISVGIISTLIPLSFMPSVPLFLYIRDYRKKAAGIP